MREQLPPATAMRRRSDWKRMVWSSAGRDHQLIVSFRRKSESIATGVRVIVVPYETPTSMRMNGGCPF